MPKLRALPLPALALVVGVLVGCIAPVPPGSGGGPNPGGGRPPPAAGDSGADAPTGGSCTLQTAGGATLCETISRCPGVVVNQASFNGCGFLIQGGAIDLECECSGYLCAASPTTTCAAVSQLLAQETASQVCSQLSSGGCQFEGLSGGSGKGGCDTACSSQCVGDPTCVQGCGC